jgi:hypothetical protein
MKRKSLLTVLIRGFLIIVLVDLIVIAGVVGLGWWTGWVELDNFQRAIQIAGLVLMALGLLGIRGKRDRSQMDNYQQGREEADQDCWERTQKRLIDLALRYSYLLVMLIAGAVCLIIGWTM